MDARTYRVSPRAPARRVDFSLHFSQDSRYVHPLDWFDRVHRLSPRAWPYTFVLEARTTAPGCFRIKVGIHAGGVIVVSRCFSGNDPGRT
jgi:hypothetical protein